MRHWHLKDTSEEGDDIYYSQAEALDALERALEEDRKMGGKITQLGAYHYTVDYPDGADYHIWANPCNDDCSP